MLGDGGNIMATPPLTDAPFGKLLIGSTPNRDPQPPDPKPYWRAQRVQPVVHITNDWLQVGHVDEILMWVATNMVLYADPWKAADLLHGEIAAGNETNALWFGFDAAGTNQTIRQVVVATNASGYKLTTLLTGMSSSTNVAIVSNAVFAANDYLRVDDEILKVTAVNATTVTVTRAEAGRPASEHSAGSRIYAYTDVLKSNLIKIGSIESIFSKIVATTNQLRQAIGSYPATFVPMPVLFTTPPDGTRYCAGTVNVVNCLVCANGSILYCDPGSSVFRTYISQVVPNSTANPYLWPLHCIYGEIHCATTAIRELGLQTPWWLQTTTWE
jgi:hypothetical protein